MLLIIALGNPGKEYQATRHNTGFMVADEILKKEHLSLRRLAKFNAEVVDFKIGRKKIILAKPLTYMNRSGDAAGALLNFYKLKPEQLVVVHDDKDIPLGAIRVQKNRGAAGHNGVASIIEKLSTKNFTRVRVGIAPADKKLEVISYFVLQKFTKSELSALNEGIKNAIAEIYKM